MRASVFCATSLDGFIARLDGGLDWLTGEGGAEIEEVHGYEAFMASVDVVVIGRGTYETVLSFAKWAYAPDMAVRVLSTRPLTLREGLPKSVETMSGSPADILAALERQGFHHAYVDGGKTIQGFLRAGLIHRMTVTRIPVLLGTGIPLFGPLPQDLHFRHVATRTYAGGLVQSVYEPFI
jgi:dihydrofolate reductase